MAGEVGHVVYAARVLTYLKDAVQQQSYWVGTLFPDIKHLGVVSRHRTHPADVRVRSLVGSNDFQTGVRVHAWVDMTREYFLRQANIKEELPWHPFVPHALKLLEDELLYDSFEDWNLIHRMLNEIYDEELLLVHDRASIQRWHSLLQDYFRQKPDAVARQELAQGIGLSEAVAMEINTVVERLRKDAKAQRMLEKFWGQLDSLLN